MNRTLFPSAAHLLLIQDDQILLARRYQTGWGDGSYSVPAGHLDGGESVASAMARETEEEICVFVKPEDLHVAHVMHRTESDGERIDFFLTTKTWQGDPIIGEPHKCNDLRWFPLSNLPDNILPYIAKAISQVQDGQSFSEFCWTDAISRESR